MSELEGADFVEAPKKRRAPRKKKVKVIALRRFPYTTADGDVVYANKGDEIELDIERARTVNDAGAVKVVL